LTCLIETLYDIDSFVKLAKHATEPVLVSVAQFKLVAGVHLSLLLRAEFPVIEGDHIRIVRYERPYYVETLSEHWEELVKKTGNRDPVALARQLYEDFIEELRQKGLRVDRGMWICRSAPEGT